MTKALLPAGGSIACVAAVTVLAALHILAGSDALALISATLGYFIHASGASSNTFTPSPKVSTPTTGVPAS